MERSFSPASHLLLLRLARVFGTVFLGAVGELIFAGHEFWRNLLSDVIILVVLGGLLAVYGRLDARNARVESGPSNLVIRNFLGLSHRVDERFLRNVVSVDGIIPASSRNKQNLGPRLYVLDGDARAVLRLHDDRWTNRQMDDLAESLALPVDSVGFIGLRELRTRYPRALRFREAHPVATVIILVLGLSAGVAAIGIAIAATS